MKTRPRSFHSAPAAAKKQGVSKAEAVTYLYEADEEVRLVYKELYRSALWQHRPVSDARMEMFKAREFNSDFGRALKLID